MKKHHIKPQKISAFIDGELSEKKMKAIEQHIDQCERCKNKLMNFQNIDHYLEYSKERIIPPVFLKQKILTHIQENNKNYKSDNFWVLPLSLKFRLMAASFAVLGILIGATLGTGLTSILIGEKEEIEITSMLFPIENISAPFLTEIVQDTIDEGKSS